MNTEHHSVPKTVSVFGNFEVYMDVDPNLSNREAVDKVLYLLSVVRSYAQGLGLDFDYEITSENVEG